jgi:hypothetical protein
MSIVRVKAERIQQKMDALTIQLSAENKSGKQSERERERESEAREHLELLGKLVMRDLHCLSWSI